MKKYILSKIVEHTIDLFECIRIHCTCICSPQHNSCLDQVDVKTRLRCYEAKQRKDSNSWHEPPMHCIHCICSTKLHIYNPLANQQSIATVPSISTADGVAINSGPEDRGPGDPRTRGPEDPSTYSLQPRAMLHLL